MYYAVCMVDWVTLQNNMGYRRTSLQIVPLQMVPMAMGLTRVATRRQGAWVTIQVAKTVTVTIRAVKLLR